LFGFQPVEVGPFAAAATDLDLNRAAAIPERLARTDLPTGIGEALAQGVITLHQLAGIEARPFAEQAGEGAGVAAVEAGFQGLEEGQAGGRGSRERSEAQRSRRQQCRQGRAGQRHRERPGKFT